MQIQKLDPLTSWQESYFFSCAKYLGRSVVCTRTRRVAWPGIQFRKRIQNHEPSALLHLKHKSINFLLHKLLLFLRLPTPDPPSTSEVRRVTLAAFLLPAGRLRPILSSLSRSRFPPSFDFALITFNQLNRVIYHVRAFQPISCYNEYRL